jgi:hypothetical protein
LELSRFFDLNYGSIKMLELWKCGERRDNTYKDGKDSAIKALEDVANQKKDDAEWMKTD